MPGDRAHQSRHAGKQLVLPDTRWANALDEQLGKRTPSDLAMPRTWLINSVRQRISPSLDCSRARCF